jgi:ribokinase
MPASPVADRRSASVNALIPDTVGHSRSILWNRLGSVCGVQEHLVANAAKDAAEPAARPRLVVLGSINMDLRVRAPRLPLAGETILGSAFATGQGGKGANQAIAAARAGAEVAMIGAIGDDAFGVELVESLTAAGVDSTGIRRLDGPSGIAVITVDNSGENTIVVAPGANGRLTELSAIDIATIRDAELLVLQLEIPLGAVTAAAEAAAAAGVPVLLNPSPATPLPPRLLASLTLLVLNEGEALTLGPDTLAAVPHLITTLGSAGARYRGPGGDELVAIPPAVEVVDTTGAGDAFTGSFAVAWLTGEDPAAALGWACAAGALATTKPGASAPTRAEIDQLANAAARGTVP